MAVNPTILRSLLNLASAPVTTGETTAVAPDISLAQTQLQNALEIGQRDAANRRAQRGTLVGGVLADSEAANEAAGNESILRGLRFDDPTAIRAGEAMRNDAQQAASDLAPQYQHFEDAAQAGVGPTLDLLAQTVGQGASSMAGPAGAGALAALLTRGKSKALSGLAGAAASYPANRAESINQIMGDPNAQTALLADPNKAAAAVRNAALVNSAIDVVPGAIGHTLVGNAAKRVATGVSRRAAASAAASEAEKSLAARALGSPIGQMAGEGVQEVTQGVVNQIADNNLQGRDFSLNDLDRKTLTDDFIGGAASAGGIHAAGHAATSGLGMLADRAGRVAAPIADAASSAKDLVSPKVKAAYDLASTKASDLYDTSKTKVTDFFSQGGTGADLVALAKNAGGALTNVAGVSANEAAAYVKDNYDINFDLGKANAVLTDFATAPDAQGLQSAFRKHFSNQELEQTGKSAIDTWLASATDDTHRTLLQTALGDPKQLGMAGTFAKRAALMQYIAMQPDTLNADHLHLAQGVLSGTLPVFGADAAADANRKAFNDAFIRSGLDAGKSLATGLAKAAADRVTAVGIDVASAFGAAAQTALQATAQKTVEGNIAAQNLGAKGKGKRRNRNTTGGNNAPAPAPVVKNNVQAVPDTTLQAAKTVLQRHMPANTPAPVVQAVHEAIPSMMAVAMRGAANRTAGLNTPEYQSIFNQLGANPAKLISELHDLAREKSGAGSRRALGNIRSASEDVAAGGTPYLKTLVRDTTANNPRRLAEVASTLDAVIGGKQPLANTKLAQHFTNPDSLAMARRYYTPKSKPDAAAKTEGTETQMSQKIKAAMGAKNAVDATDVSTPEQDSVPGRRYSPHFVQRTAAYSVHVADDEGNARRDVVTRDFSKERAARGSEDRSLALVPGDDFAADLEDNNESVRHYLNKLQADLRDLLETQASKSPYTLRYALSLAGSVFGARAPKTFAGDLSTEALDAGYADVGRYKYAISSVPKIARLTVDKAVDTIPPSVVADRLVSALVAEATASALGKPPTDSAVYRSALVQFALAHKASQNIVAKTMQRLAKLNKVPYGSAEYQAAARTAPSRSEFKKDAGGTVYMHAVVDRLNAVSKAIYNLDAGKPNPLKGLLFSVKEGATDALPSQPERTVADDAMIKAWSSKGGHLDASTVQLVFDNGKKLNLSADRMAGTATFVENPRGRVDLNHAKFSEALARLVARDDVARINFIPNYGLDYLQHRVNGALTEETRAEHTADLEKAAAASTKAALAPVEIYNAEEGKLDTSDIPPTAWIKSPSLKTPSASRAVTAYISREKTIIAEKPKSAERVARQRESIAAGREKARKAVEERRQAVHEDYARKQLQYDMHRNVIVDEAGVEVANAQDERIRAKYFGKKWKSKLAEIQRGLKFMYPFADDNELATDAEGDGTYGPTEVTRLNARLEVLQERLAFVNAELSAVDVADKDEMRYRDTLLFARADIEGAITDTETKLDAVSADDAAARKKHERTFGFNPTYPDERHGGGAQHAARIAAIQNKLAETSGSTPRERAAAKLYQDETPVAPATAQVSRKTPEPSTLPQKAAAKRASGAASETAIDAIVGNNKRRTRFQDIVSLGRLFPARSAPVIHPDLKKLNGADLSKFIQGEMSTTALLATVGLTYAKLRDAAPALMRAAHGDGLWARAVDTYGEARATKMYTNALPALLHEYASSALATSLVDEMSRAIRDAASDFNKKDRSTATPEENREAFFRATASASPSLQRAPNLRSLLKVDMLNNPELQRAVQGVLRTRGQATDVRELRSALYKVVARLPETGDTRASTSANLAVQLKRMSEQGNVDAVKEILGNPHVNRRVKLAARIADVAQLLREDRAYRKMRRDGGNTETARDVMLANSEAPESEVQALIDKIRDEQPALPVMRGVAAGRTAESSRRAANGVYEAPARTPVSRQALQTREERQRVLQARRIERRKAAAQTREDARTDPTKKFNRQANVDAPTDVTEQALQQQITKRLGADVKLAYSKLHSELGGNSGTFTPASADTTRLIEIAVNATSPLQILSHESMHALLDMLKKTPDTRRTIRQLENTAQDPQIRRYMLTKLVAQDVEAGVSEAAAARKFNTELNDAEESVAYMFQFWEHDPEFRAMLKKGTNGILSSIAKFLRGLFGLISESEKADKIFAAFVEGKLANASKRETRFTNISRETFGDKTHKLLGPIEDTFSRLYIPGLTLMRESGVPALKALSERMFSPVGADVGSASFIDSRRASIGMFTGQLARLVEAYDAVDLKDALHTLQSREEPDTDAAKALAAYVNGLERFASSLKVDMKSLISGMPVVWDTKKVTDNREEFTKLLQDNAGMDAETAEDFIAELLAMGNNTGTSNNKYLLGYGKNTDGYIATLKMLAGSTAAPALAAYQVDDIHLALEQYTKDLVQRAVFTHFFGADGGAIEAAFAAAKKQGATYDEIKAARGAVENALGVYKKDAVTASMRELMGWTMTGLNVLLLPLGIVSQLIDPFALAARSGDANDIWRGYWKPLQRLFRAGKRFAGFENAEDYHEEMAKTLGLMAEDVSEALMGHVTTGTSAALRKINSFYFKANGMAGWNDSQRIVALAAAERYILSAKENGEGHKLAELGLNAAAVKVDEKGRLIYQGLDNLPVQVALRRFIESSVVRADNVHQPSWMSDPRFLLLAHMKRFTYAFSNTVLQRAYKRWEKYDEIGPMAYLAGAMPVIMVVDMAKWAMFGGPSTATWTMTDYLAHMLARTGLLGTGSAYVSLSHMSLLPRFDFGPAVEMVAKVGKNGFGEVPGMTLIGRR